VSEYGLIGAWVDGWSWPLFWLAVMGLVAMVAFVWSLILWSFHDWPNVTQTNRKTGITHHGGWYKTRRIVIAAVVGPAVFCLIAVWLWHWQAIVAPVALAVLGFFIWRYFPREDQGVPVPDRIISTAPVYAPVVHDDRDYYLTPFQQPQHGTPPADQPLWSLPEHMRHGRLGE